MVERVALVEVDRDGYLELINEGVPRSVLRAVWRWWLREHYFGGIDDIEVVWVPDHPGRVEIYLDSESWVLYLQWWA
jgi:hypothetical protein